MVPTGIKPVFSCFSLRVHIYLSMENPEFAQKTFYKCWIFLILHLHVLWHTALLCFTIFTVAFVDDIHYVLQNVTVHTLDILS
ncbi:hypothetical protein ACJX0J_018632, partial [Zea mays]